MVGIGGEPNFPDPYVVILASSVLMYDADVGVFIEFHYVLKVSKMILINLRDSSYKFPKYPELDFGLANITIEKIVSF